MKLADMWTFVTVVFVSRIGSFTCNGNDDVGFNKKKQSKLCILSAEYWYKWQTSILPASTIPNHTVIVAMLGFKPWNCFIFFQRIRFWATDYCPRRTVLVVQSVGQSFGLAPLTIKAKEVIPENFDLNRFWWEWQWMPQLLSADFQQNINSQNHVKCLINEQ